MRLAPSGSCSAGPPRWSVTQDYVGHLERGLKKNPSLEIVKRPARALGVPVAELLE